MNLQRGNVRGERKGAAVASRATGAASWQAQRAQRLAIELPETAKQSFCGGVQREGLQKRVARGEKRGRVLGRWSFFAAVFCAAWRVLPHFGGVLRRCPVLSG